MLPQSYLWLPIALAMPAALLILLWLVTRSHLFLSGLAASVPPASGRASASQETQPQTSEGTLSPVFTPEVLAWRSDIQRWAEAYHLDPNLIATVMQIESCGHPSVLSSSGAIGLFQVMPFHFPTGEDPFDPETNAMRGMNYLARGLALSGGRMDLALAGYNGGHGVIGLDSSQWPSETQRYVAWGNGILSDIAGGSTQSPSLQAWLHAGGENLCRRAAIAIASLHTSNTP